MIPCWNNINVNVYKCVKFVCTNLTFNGHTADSVKKLNAQKAKGKKIKQEKDW